MTLKYDVKYVVRLSNVLGSMWEEYFDSFSEAHDRMSEFNKKEDQFASMRKMIIYDLPEGMQ